ncbi:MAG: hypothetical protein IH621_01660 [Krumholzibacteria bacterium]|nr:hypothetical protein [Candidatus Krumholzibacteria bacterium]
MQLVYNIVVIGAAALVLIVVIGLVVPYIQNRGTYAKQPFDPSLYSTSSHFLKGRSVILLDSEETERRAGSAVTLAQLYGRLTFAVPFANLTDSLVAVVPGASADLSGVMASVREDLVRLQVQRQHLLAQDAFPYAELANLDERIKGARDLLLARGRLQIEACDYKTLVIGNVVGANFDTARSAIVIQLDSCRPVTDLDVIESAVNSSNDRVKIMGMMEANSRAAIELERRARLEHNDREAQRSRAAKANARQAAAAQRREIWSAGLPRLCLGVYGAIILIALFWVARKASVHRLGRTASSDIYYVTYSTCRGMGTAALVVCLASMAVVFLSTLAVIVSGNVPFYRLTYVAYCAAVAALALGTKIIVWIILLSVERMAYVVNRYHIAHEAVYRERVDGAPTGIVE